MHLPKYPLSASERMMTFEFVSEGKNGLIYKIVSFQPTNLKGVYNLAFGDKNKDTGEIDDMVISNNGDSEKVLATVVATVYAFTDRYPETWIYITGSKEGRTRLYQMGITKYYSEVSNDFELLGERLGNWEIFRNNVVYEGFLVKRRD